MGIHQKTLSKAVEERLPPTSDTWGTLEKGDRVKIRFSHSTFTFLSVRLDANGDVDSVNLYGGPKHHEKLRSIRPEDVHIPTDNELKAQRKVRTARQAAGK